MRFPVDERTGPSVAGWLLSEAHDVLSVYDEARRMSDGDVLAKAETEQRILITNDKDFGEMVFRERRPHCSVIFLRLEDERPAAKIDALRRALMSYARQLPDAFVVVTE